MSFELFFAPSNNRSFHFGLSRNLWVRIRSQLSRLIGDNCFTFVFVRSDVSYRFTYTYTLNGQYIIITDGYYRYIVSCNLTQIVIVIVILLTCKDKTRRVVKIVKRQQVQHFLRTMYNCICYVPRRVMRPLWISTDRSRFIITSFLFFPSLLELSYRLLLL